MKTWKDFWADQRLSWKLAIKGVFILIGPCYRREWELRQSTQYPKQILSWKNPALYIYGNEEDGVTGAEWYRKQYGESRITAYRWSALRNSTGNFRWDHSCIGGPFYRKIWHGWYFQKGYRPDTGWPVLSLGTVPKGGFDYGNN